MSQFQRGLAAELDDHAHDGAVFLFPTHNVDDVFRGQRLEIEAVCGIVIGGNGFRVAVDHDGLMTGLAAGHNRMNAAIIELDALTDPVRTAAKDDDLVAVARLRFTFWRIDTVALVTGVEIRGR